MGRGHVPGGGAGHEPAALGLRREVVRRGRDGVVQPRLVVAVLRGGGALGEVAEAHRTDLHHRLDRERHEADEHDEGDRAPDAGGQAERDKRVRLAEANAKAVSGETTAQASIAGAQATLAVRNAEAYQLSETKKREAEAA